MQLAIDTSTDTASLALVQDNKILAELSWCCGQNHTVTLLPSLVSLLSKSGLEIGSITGIIVAKGPGSYNGLRVGISTAKGLALSLGVPIAGVSTLEAAAYQHAEAGLPVCALFNAGRGEIAAAIYQVKDGRWQPIISEHITTIEALCSHIDKKTIFCGELSEEISEQLRELIGEKAVVVSMAARLRRAGFLAELGNRRLMAKDLDSHASISPMYLRRPHITKPRRGKNRVGR